MLFKSLFIVFLACLIIGPARSRAGERPERLVLAHENRNAYPWVYQRAGDPAFSGLDIDLLLLAGERMGVTVEFRALPWIRALETMRRGAVDGAFASSYVPAREEQGVYPRTPEGALDAERRLHLSGYALYVLEDSDVHFDGKTFSGVPRGIAVQNNFSIADILRRRHDFEPVEVGHADPAPLLDMVLAGRVSAAALQTDRAEYILESQPRFRGTIMAYRTDKEPFRPKPYFLMFSRQFYEAYPDFAEAFWDVCRDVRHSDEYRARASLLIE